ncbi:hypothetical protein SADUNF_Sadunf02G0147500 [Salix dunnii]|uniref:Uncharacterized protein n=1 Tax=Salix dunnii TaxID=1413687 RepID=A0A835THH5_9ROSI|nr:hypothetical protein SADUNF_Sadunf02G0147500 [Salix dunnii]
MQFRKPHLQFRILNTEIVKSRDPLPSKTIPENELEPIRRLPLLDLSLWRDYVVNKRAPLSSHKPINGTV